MNFTIHQLQILLEVSRQGSITKAAEAMFMTQPAISIQLKNLQSQFDIPLTEKVGKKICLTEFGKSIALISENILNEADAIRFKTKEYKGLLTGRLKISSASTGKYVIPYFISDFINVNPGIDLTLDVSNKDTVVQSLKSNEIDFALVSVLPDKLEVEQEKLLENKLFLVSNIEKYKRNRPLIYREPGSATRFAMDQYFKNKSIRKSISLTSNEAVKQAIIAGLGQSIIPLLGIENELANKQLFIIPSSGLPIITYWRLIWLKGKKMSPIAEAYLQFVQKEKERIVSTHFGWHDRIG